LEEKPITLYSGSVKPLRVLHHRWRVQRVLKCQIVVDGRPTAWCAQHDAKTFEPRPARSYELATTSGSESVGVVRFLMSIDRPSPEVVRAVHSAAEWFDKAKLTGIRVD
jgi:pectinesterase